MYNFNYYTPTKVVFGKGTIEKVGELVKLYGGTKVLIHYGGQSAVKSGLIDRVKAALDAEGIPHVELGGVVPNPHLEKVYEGIELCKKEGVDFNALDGKPSQIFIMIASPESSSGPHMRVMAAISGALMQKDIREAILEADSPEKVIDILKKSKK